MGPNQRCRTFYRSKFSSSLPKSSNQPVTPPLSLPFIKKDPAQPLVAFTKEDYKNAELKCLTKADCSSIYFGFTAESQFYHNDILQVQSTIFSHHQQSLQIMASKYGRNLKIELRYGFFSKLNFEIRLYGQCYCWIKLTVVYTQCPLFYYAEEKPGETFTRYIRFNPQKEDEEGFWKNFVGSTAMQLSFVLDRSNLFSFLDSLSSTASCSILYTPLVDNYFNTYRIDHYLLTAMKDCPWNIRYCIEAIKSCGTVGSFFMDYVLHEKNERVNVKKNGIWNEPWALFLFSEMYAYLKCDISLASLDFSPDNNEQRQRRDDFVMIKTVYITPTRKILTLEEATMNSRGFRKLGVDNLIQIKFRDDSLSWFPTDDLLLENVVKTICRDGVDIAGRKFFEFGGSSSLFREHGSYFYATENKNEIIEKWKTLGEFKVEAAAKVQARIGQYFTSAREIRFKLRLSDVALIDDYMSDCKDSAGQPYCFSDGCGTIDPILARTIADELQLTYIPSAFQFRFAGFKGMVAVDYNDTRLKYKDGPYFLLLRHSQKKFHVEDDGELLDLDIVQWSAPTPSRLHGAFISMIDSLAVYNGKRDIVRARLRQLHNQTFVDIIKPLVDEIAFLATLEKLPQYIPVYKLKTKNLIHQPFLRGMIEANAVLNARLLANKSQIAIPSDLGRSAHGIVDTTGSLKEGQVFFQFSSSVNTKSSSGESGNLKRGGFNPVLKLGRVGVTKSPIYHVGDIRYLEAVEALALMDKVDVLVFPSCGTRPHTDEIGGGDIDGDCYTIFWDPAFLLDFSAQPNDYTAPSVEGITKVDLHGLQENAPDIRVKYLKSNNLEQLSTTHLAHLTLHDPLHEDCEKLARKADKAVNFFKSGLEAEELEEYERPVYWPKSMNKTHEPGYTNSHILCELYEKSTSVLHLITIAQREAQQNREKSGLIDKGNIVITESDMKMFSEYKKDINAIKVRYQVKSEGELFSNAIINVPGVLKNYKDPMGDDGCPSALVQRKVFEVFEKFRTRILNRFDPNWKAEMDMKNENIFTYKIHTVSEEMIQLAKTFYAMAEDDGECYSFPWIVWEGLDAWLCQNDLSSHNENMNHENEICNLVSKNTVYASAFMALQKEHSAYPWFSYFAVMFHSFMVSNDLLPELVSAAVNFYIHTLEEKDVNRSVTIPNDANEAFFYFLITIISPNFYHDGPEDENEFIKLYKAAQSTLISYAFFPENKHFFGIKLHEQSIKYPPFVISVPSVRSKIFEQKYNVLKKSCNVEQIVIEKRKILTQFIHYTIMCRGTLESCQKLESMLTPKIEMHETKSMKETKSWKGRKMQNLLTGIFGFNQNTQRNGFKENTQRKSAYRKSGSRNSPY